MLSWALLLHKLRAGDQRRRVPVGRRQAAIVLTIAVLVDLLAAHNTSRHLVPAALAAIALAGGGLGLLAVRRPLGTLVALSVALLAVLLPDLLLWRGADQAFRHFVPRESESRVAVQSLDARGLVTGYSDYWSAYPISFLAAERIVVAPAVPASFGGRFDRYPAYTQAVDTVEDPQRLYLLLDDRCAPLPYVLVLEQQGATYQLEHLARWYLLWDIRTEPGAGAETLASWRRVIYDREFC
jgi:hypothetical protein